MRKKYSKYSDRHLLELLAGTRKQSEAAFAEIYDRYALRVNAYCKTILDNDDTAEDVFQETFLKFYQFARSEKTNSGIIGFLITIARNLCLNAKRDIKHNISLDSIDLAFEGEQSYEDKETSSLVIYGLDLIEKEYKEAIIMRFFNDLSYKEIGKIMNITDARARYLVFTGKQRLKEVLKPYFEDYKNIK